MKRFYFALFDDGLTLNFGIGIYWFLNPNSSSIPCYVMSEVHVFYYFSQITIRKVLFLLYLVMTCTVEPLYNEVLGTMKITLLYQVSHIRVKKHKEIHV